jgi:hypothetical protein
LPDITVPSARTSRAVGFAVVQGAVSVIIFIPFVAERGLWGAPLSSPVSWPVPCHDHALVHLRGRAWTRENPAVDRVMPMSVQVPENRQASFRGQPRPCGLRGKISHEIQKVVQLICG